MRTNHKGSNQYLRRKNVAWYNSCYMFLLLLPLTMLVCYVFKNYHITRVQASEVIISPIPLDVTSYLVTSPARKTSSPPVQPKDTQHQEIIAYIKQVFGGDATRAFQLLSCENGSYAPDRVNEYGNNPAGSRDIGVFQINEYWQAVQAKYLFNWKINVQIAKQLFDENDRSFRMWTCGQKLGI